jgi:hypothetical protein
MGSSAQLVVATSQPVTDYPKDYTIMPDSKTLEANSKGKAPVAATKEAASEDSDNTQDSTQEGRGQPLTKAYTKRNKAIVTGQNLKGNKNN